MGCSAGKELNATVQHEPPSHRSRISERFGPTVSSQLRESELFVTFPAYFVDVQKLRRLASVQPTLLLLPWEMMKKMGVLRFVSPRNIAYTYISHHWESREHPWPNGLVILENLDRITTPYLWADWW